MASREPCLALVRLHRLELADHVLEEEQRAVVHARQAGAETATEALLFMFGFDFLGLFLPVNAKGRVGEEVVEFVRAELVVVERVTEADFAVLAAFDEEVGLAATAKARLLSSWPKTSGWASAWFRSCRQRCASANMPPVPQVGSRSLRTVPGRGEQVVVVDEEQVDHQADDVAGREVIARGLVGQFVEAADEVLEEQPHVVVD